MPVSTIATSASTRSSTPLIFAIVLLFVKIRETPVGVVWPATWMTSSGTTAKTLGSASSALRCFASSRALKPRIVLPKVRSALIPFWRPIRSTVALVSVPSSRRTM